MKGGKHIEKLITEHVRLLFNGRYGFRLKCSNQFNNVITDIKHATTSNIAKKTKNALKLFVKIGSQYLSLIFQVRALRLSQT